MDNNPDYGSLLRLAQSPEGQTLIQLLRNADGEALKKVVNAAASGDMAGARQMLSRLLQDRQAMELLKKLEEQL